MPTSASFVVEFIKGRPKLEAEVRKLLDQPYRAPEIMISMVADHVIETMGTFVTEDERKGLSRMEGNGSVNWNEVTRPFQKRPQRCFYCDVYKDVWEDSGGNIDCREGRDVHEWRHVDNPLKPIEEPRAPEPLVTYMRSAGVTGATTGFIAKPKPYVGNITFEQFVGGIEKSAANITLLGVDTDSNAFDGDLYEEHKDQLRWLLEQAAIKLRDGAQLREIAKGLLDNLPRCTNHPDVPATKAKYRGNGRYCDECGEGIADYPRAEWIRKLAAFLAEKT